MKKLNLCRTRAGINKSTNHLFAYYPYNRFHTSVGQSIELRFNPKLYITGPRTNFEFFPATLNPAVEGIIFFGARNVKASPGYRQLAVKL